MILLMAVMSPLTPLTAKPLPAHYIHLLSTMVTLMGTTQWGPQVKSESNCEGIVIELQTHG